MKLFKETDDIWRLYHREWVTVHTLPESPGDLSLPIPAQPIFEAAWAWVTDNLAGRVRDTDINIVLHTDDDNTFWARVEVFKDNLKGEFKHVEAAQTHAAIEKYDEYTIVPRNSKSDHEIRSYGVVSL